MGRRVEDSEKRDKLVAFRLNHVEALELEQKSRHRGLGTSSYFRTLLKEDTGVVSND